MARTKPKLSFASAGGKPSLKISSADWQRIESVYGRSLPDSVRRKICAVTRKFLDWAVFEHTVRPSSEAMERVQSIKKAVHEFQKVVFTCPANVGSDADLFARHLICRHSNLASDKGRDGLHNLALNLANSISKGCELALAQLKSKQPTFRSGDMWNWWVCELTEVLKADELPTEARKDTDKSKTEKPSPFVGFIRELQACIPKEYRGTTHSDSALAVAIVRARVPFGSQKTVPSQPK
jgi:hypothetical protein